MRNTFSVRRPVVQVVLIILLLAVGAVAFTTAQDYAWVTSSPATYSTLRVYGGPGWPKLPGNMGAGSGVATDEITGNLAETQPYTESLSIFNPQLAQAPQKDSVTWNPIWMYHGQTYDENWVNGLYGHILRSSQDASEKVWFRMWYEPEHWDKDLNANDRLDRDEYGQPVAPVNPTSTSIDEWYPAIMQEFTYMLMEPGPLSGEPLPVAGQVGFSTKLVFPVGMRATDLFTDTGVVDISSENALYGYGLTSLDGNFDGDPDIVHVESELSLFDKTDIAADFDGNGEIDPLDRDGVELSGDELVILRLDIMSVPVTPTTESYIQFLDHLVRVDSVYNLPSPGASVEIYYTGDLSPLSLGPPQSLGIGDMFLVGTGSTDYIQAVSTGGWGTNMCDFPTGPFFVYLDSVNTVEGTAMLMVGRALGATYSGMEDTAGMRDRRPGDPWFLKRFYVDGHEYNVVAIKTDGLSAPYANDCDLDDNDDGHVDTPPGVDTTGFKFITIRTPIPKVPVIIEQHSVDLQSYAPQDWLSVMPPYNYEHYIIEDVQAITAFDDDEDDVDYFGKLVGRVPPILQQNGPVPYDGATPGDAQGTYAPYDNDREIRLTYIEEDENPQFLGELKEKYGEYYATEPVTREIEFWYVEQWWTIPWQYTEFVLPDIRDDITGVDDPDLYLLTSSFTAPQAEYRQWLQDVDTPLGYNTTIVPDSMPEGWEPRVKLWFNPADADKTYKNEEGVRIFSVDRPSIATPLTEFYPGPGNPTVTDPEDDTYPVEVPPYTDPWAPFNPQLPEAPRKDSLTFNPAYMDRSLHGGESLSALYPLITIEEHDAREKVFLRMWYEPEYLDKILEGSTSTYTETYTFPAVMQEFTYMFLDTLDWPSHGLPQTSRFVFPMATAADELPAPDPVTLDIPPASLPSFGYGLTTFDADFDGTQDIVTIHSEETISDTLTRSPTGIGVDFDGNGSIDQLDIDGVELTGDELVIFAVEDIQLTRGESAMFLDHMITLDTVADTDAWFRVWYTGGGNNPPSYSLHPDYEGTVSLDLKEMALVYKNSIRTLSQGQNNLGWAAGSWGPWFVYLQTTNPGQQRAEVTIGRALGATHSAMDDGAGQHDWLAGDPWWLKRFFVDGHEYNTVAIKTVLNDEAIQNTGQVTPTGYISITCASIPYFVPSGDECWEFKYVTIRTPLPKENFVNTQDSQKLEGYNLGTVHGVSTTIMSVMPPFNFNHTRLQDIQKLEEEQFANPDFYEGDCMGDLEGNVDPLVIEIVDEDRDEQFFGELKEKYWEYEDMGTVEIWSTEQFHILPDQYTDLQLPAGQLYLLTTDWRSDQSWLHYYGCDPADGTFTQDELNGWNAGIPATNAVITFTGGVTNTYFNAVTDTVRVKFWYDPLDTEDIYKNTREITCTLIATATNSGPVCDGAAVTLFGDPDGMAAYHWTGPGGFESFAQDAVVDPAVAGTYTLVITDTNGCSDSDTTVVVVNATPTASITPDPAEVCAGVDLSLNGNPAGGSGTYVAHSWTGDTGPLSATDVVSPTFNTATPGTYNLTYTVTDTLGCVGVDSITVTVHPNPTASITPDPAEVCAGVDLLLNGNPAGGSGSYSTHSWTGDTGPLSATNVENPTFNTATPGTYNLTYTVTDSEGCVGSDSITVTVHPNPTASITPDPAEVCAGVDLSLNGNPSGGSGSYSTHSWTGDTGPLSATNVQNPTFNATTPGTYNLTYCVTDSEGCVGCDSITVTVNPNPTPSITPDPAEVCAGVDLLLNGNPSGGSGVYITHSWTGDTGPLSSTSVQNPTFNTTTPGTYNLTYCVTDSEGCTGCDSIAVVVHANPTASITPDPAEVCAGVDLLLNGNPMGGSGIYIVHSWTGDTGPLSATNVQNPTFNTTTPGTYNLTYTVTDSEGCVGSDSITVTVNPNPAASITPDPAELCAGDSLQLHGNPSGGSGVYITHSWTGDTVPLSATNVENPTFDTLTSTTPGTYNLTYCVTDSEGCTGCDSIAVVVHANPTASITPDPAELCAGDSLQLYGNPSGGSGSYTTHSWTGDTVPLSATNVQNPVFNTFSTTTPGIYNLTYCVTDSEGCTGCDSIAVTVTGPCGPRKVYFPMVPRCYPAGWLAISNNGPVCEGATIELYGPNGMDSYSWTGPGGWTSSLQNPTRSNATMDMVGIYTLNVTYSGCSASDTTYVTVNAKPDATASSNSPVDVGDTIQLYGGPGGMASYSWTGPGGWTSSAQNPTRSGATTGMAGTYTLTVVNSSGCSDTASTSVVVHTPQPSCEEKICNGGFETVACWETSPTPRPAAYSSVMSRTGSWSMRLGITSQSDAYSWSSTYQQVTIPGNVTSATLSFWYYPICYDTFPYDYQEVIIFDSTLSHKLAYVMPQTCSNSQTWTLQTYDLMAFKGQTINIYFNVKNDGVGNLKSAMYVDDVSVYVCY